MPAASAARSVTRFGRAPRLTKSLRIDKTSRLPIPHLKFQARQFAPSRIEDHYYTTLQDNLMYMTYKHEHLPRPPPRQIRLTFDPNDPYSKNRHNPPVGGNQSGRKPLPPDTPENVIHLEKLVIHSMLKDAIQNRSNLLGVIMALRALAGENHNQGGVHGVNGVQIVRGKKAVGGWIRPGVPVGAQVELRGAAMYDFIGTLVEFVLPRLRDFPGVVLPPASSSDKSPSAVSGVVSFGLPTQAMGFFPQIEVNLDSYPKPYGMHLHFVTNARGVGAQNRARALVSGFQVPFVRK